MSDAPPVAAPNPAGMRWLRRYIWFSLALVGLFPLAVMPDLFTADFGTVNRILLTALVVLAVVQRTRFIGYAARAVEFTRRRPVEQILTTSVAVVAWAHAARYTSNPALWALLPAVVGGAGVISAPPEYRRRLSGGLVLATAVTGALALSWRRVDGVLVPNSVVAAVLIVLGLVLVDVTSARFWELVLELDRARELAGELATARERLRFAADLHDIQGHSLQAIVLKGQLAERLVGKDDDAARRHAAELTELARSALADTRKLAHGYREIGLVTEAGNAAELMRAAGIDVEVRGDPAAIAPPLQQPFSALVREGTTNVLRHSRAQRCVLAIEVTDGEVTVRIGNDGVRHLGEPDGTGTGVHGLRERFAVVGGAVTAGRAGEDWFELAGTAREPGGGPR
ncbi:sensor histidine kinase [Prauserella flavalba]|uniref:Signal transduction histidine kinase subgroup 3 dimerisation and phosphoacceptor domain-containing protein n=1 Tax=Prauserella flavalba TaxID=1477506 RepID=A0A318LNZ3_9PSEU|nr:histidine kinase [Prauserella flavalba]PXY36302.1 hypothetical protein BA062_12860 [Prauserella flavalba]